MRIENIEAFVDRIDEAIEIISKDERYEESLVAFLEAKECIDIYEFDECKQQLSNELHGADGAYPMHPVVAIDL